MDLRLSLDREMVLMMITLKAKQMLKIAQADKDAQNG